MGRLAALFPAGYSWPVTMKVGGWRDNASGPMQMAAGLIGRQRVRYKVPPIHRLESEISRIPDWLHSASNEPPLLKVGLGIFGLSPCIRSTTATTPLNARQVKLLNHLLDRCQAFGRRQGRTSLDPIK